MKKTLLKSFDGIKLNHGDTLSWEFNDSFENPFEYVAHLYKIEKEESDLTPLQNFKKGLKNILRQISIGDDDIIYYDDILRIEGISWNEKFTIDWSLIEELKLYVKGTDVKLEMNTTEYDDSDAIRIKIEIYTKELGDMFKNE